jgi:hypothetical protein
VALVDFRRIGLYHLPLLPWRGRRLLAAWQRGEVAFPLLGLRPSAAWSSAGLRLEAMRSFNSYPPLGGRLRPETYLAIERRLGPTLAPVLSRTTLALFRRGDSGLSTGPAERSFQEESK